MPAVSLSTADIHRKYGKLPHFHLTNGFIEEDKTNGVDGMAWLQRPGLSNPVTLGSGGFTRMVWEQEGTLSGDWIVLVGTQLYRLSAYGTPILIGAIPGTDYPVAAGGSGRMIIVSGSVAYSTDGMTLTQVAMPDGQPVSSVAYINGYFLLSVEGSQVFYWIAPGGTNPEPLDFASAERVSDNIITVVTQGDTVWFLKQTNEEVWVPTGSSDAPFQRISGRVSTFGCASRNSVAACGTAIVWVTADRQIVSADGTPKILSSPSDTEALRAASSDMRAWYYGLDGHSFYILTTNIGTFVSDLSTGSMARYNSQGRDAWRAHLGAQRDDRILAGDSESNTVWTVDPSASSDDGDAVTREVTGYIANVGEPISCDSLSLNVDAGWSPAPDFEPILQMRFSDDQGNLWSSWKEKGLGTQGHYGKNVTFRSLGLVVRPGRLFQFRMTDDARFRLSWVRINEV